MYLDIPNLRNVSLPHSFEEVQYKTITSRVSFVPNTCLDISNELAKILPLLIEDIRLLDTTISTLVIPDNSCNQNELTILDLSSFTLVESIEIGESCFKSVQTFNIEGLNRLKSLKIGNCSFTRAKNNEATNEAKLFHILNCESLECIEIDIECFGSYHEFLIDGLDRLKTIKIGENSFTYYSHGNNCDKSKSFHILNCKSLESIQIGRFSFSDFGGDFELKNLPQLQSIQIGTIGSESYNFYYSSFVIRGIELILNIVMIRSSKSTIHYIR